MGRTAIVSILAALVLVVMVPRLRSAEFGMLDDGVTVYVSQALAEAWSDGDPFLVLRLENGRGRFRPLYWLFEAAQYAIWGPSARGFFVGNAVALLLTALAVAATVAAATRDRLASLLAGVAYVLAPPVAESYYTLSKPEVPLALWLAVSLWTWAAARVDSETGGRRRRALLAVSAASLLLAYFTKETAQVMMPVSALWLVASWRRARSAPASAAARVDRWYFAVNVAWVALFWMLRVASGTAGVAAGEDSQRYALTSLSIVSSGLAHLVWYARDFPFLLPLVAFLAWPRARPGGLDPWTLLVAIFWVLGWTAIMLPWPAIFEYFLLPASIGVAVIVGLGVAAAVRALHAPDRTLRIVAGVLLAVLLLCLPVTLSGGVTSARIQLVVDAANGSLVDFLATRAPAGTTVLVDLPEPNEYVHELQLHLALLKGRRDVEVTYREGRQIPRDGTVFVAVHHMRNRPLPGVRLPLTETELGIDQARGRYGAGAVLAHHVTRRIDLFVPATPAPICAVLEHAQAHADLFCASDRLLVDRRRFRYGWQVYRVDGH